MESLKAVSVPTVSLVNYTTNIITVIKTVLSFKDNEISTSSMKVDEDQTCFFLL